MENAPQGFPFPAFPVARFLRSPEQYGRIMHERLNQAIAFAVEAHSRQMRKIEPVPFILHPMEAAVIASQMTSDEDVLIAALLHDTVEDAGVRPEEIRSRFGERAAYLVERQTEDKRRELPPEVSWKTRKTESLRVLQSTDDLCVKILWLSDKLANLRSLYRSWRRDGDGVFRFFHQSDKRAQAWYYRTVANSVAELKDTPAYMEYVRLIDAIFKED